MYDYEMDDLDLYDDYLLPDFPSDGEFDNYNLKTGFMKALPYIIGMAIGALLTYLWYKKQGKV
jgi:hypothetical protein